MQQKQKGTTFTRNHHIPGLLRPRPMAETPKDFARHLLLRSHPALCTPSGFYSPGRSSYPSRPYSCVSLEEFFFTKKFHPRSWKKKRLAIGVPLHDPENERHRSGLFLSGPDSKCGQKMKEKKQKKNVRDSTRCCDGRKSQTKKEKTTRSDLHAKARDCQTKKAQQTLARCADLQTRCETRTRTTILVDEELGWETWTIPGSYVYFHKIGHIMGWKSWTQNRDEKTNNIG